MKRWLADGVGEALLCLFSFAFAAFIIALAWMRKLR